MMPLKAGFSEIDITPPVGTLKIGWKKIIVSDTVLDPLFARVVAFEFGGEGVGFVQLDTLSIRWTQVSQIRARITEELGFPGENVMVAATHNHAGPAVANCGDVPRDEEYIEDLTGKVLEAFGKALPLSGIILAKLDSTARGGIVVGLLEEFGIPVKLVGTGEGLEDLEVFDPEAFIQGVFEGSR